MFQGRDKAILCDSEAYLLELVRYLYFNPSAVADPEDSWRYPWSSQAVSLKKSSFVQV